MTALHEHTAAAATAEEECDISCSHHTGGAARVEEYCNEDAIEDHSAIVESGEEDRIRELLQSIASKNLRSLRVLLSTILTVSTVLIALGVYFFLKNGQQDDFESDFYSQASRITQAFLEAIQRRLIALDYLASTITSHVVATSASSPSSTWPNVSLPDWEIHSGTARILSQALAIVFMPLVTDETRAGWEDYARKHQFVQQESFARQEEFRMEQDAAFGYNTDTTTATTNDTLEAAISNETSRMLVSLRHQQTSRVLTDNLDQFHLHNTIWGNNEWELGQPYGTGPYFPAWHTSPVFPTTHFNMFNFATWPLAAHGIQACVTTQKAVLGRITTDPQASNSTGLTEYVNLLLQQSHYRYVASEYENDPFSYFFYPIFDSFHKDRKLTGLLFATVYWRLVFLDLLPDSARGFVVVVRYSGGQAITYQIDGSEITYLGPGDLHDPQFNHMVLTTDMTGFVHSTASPQTRPYRGVELDGDYGRYFLDVYPSDTLEDDYMTNEPITYMLAVIGIFCFTFLLFLSFDLFAEKRKKELVERAVKSGAIVSSLYPKAVRDRLLAEPEADYQYHPPQKRKVSLGIGIPMVRRNSAGSYASNETPVASEAPSAADKIIAELHPNCTVLFADMAGFTKWSSTRTPTEVFQLLETLYNGFDKVAMRCKVFKVETIGDCYVAATGLPDAQPDHAIIMVRFATEIMYKMRGLLHGLSETLGADTLELGLRIGLHSGPVTAGVLRGQKARFQLFGDTVNTASRMESHGLVGRIHASQSTADAIVASGKLDWVSRRQEQIAVKGKGDMQTYWVTVPEKSIIGTEFSFGIVYDPETAKSWRAIPEEALGPYNDPTLVPTATDDVSELALISELEPINDEEGTGKSQLEGVEITTSSKINTSTHSDVTSRTSNHNDGEGKHIQETSRDSLSSSGIACENSHTSDCQDNEAISNESGHQATSVEALTPNTEIELKANTDDEATRKSISLTEVSALKVNANDGSMRTITNTDDALEPEIDVSSPTASRAYEEGFRALMKLIQEDGSSNTIVSS